MIKENVLLFLKPTVHLSDTERFVKFFALSANASLLMGGDLKRREFLSGRYADMLSFIISNYAVEWYATQSNLPNDYVQYFQTLNLKRMHTTCLEIIQNHPHKTLHKIIQAKTIGLYTTYNDIEDTVKAKIVKDMTNASSTIRSIFEEDTLDLHPNVSRINMAMTMDKKSDDYQKLKEEIIRVDVFDYYTQKNNQDVICL